MSVVSGLLAMPAVG